MIIIPQEHIKTIREHGEKDYPYECCGIMFGRFGEKKLVSELRPINNEREDEAKHNRFLITPQEIAKAEMYAHRSGLDILGFYHSHPDHPAEPSEYDRLYAWPVYSYIIVSVKKGVSAELTSWVLSDDRSIFNSEIIG